MRDGAMWMMLLIGAASLGAGWTDGLEALKVEVESWAAPAPIVPQDAVLVADDRAP